MSSYTDGAKSGKAEQLGVADLYSFFQRYAEGETVTQDILFPPLYVDRELLFCRIISDESGPRLRVLKFTGETYDYSISSRGEGELVLMSALGPNSSGVIAYASQCAIYRRGAEAGENSAHLTNFYMLIRIIRKPLRINSPQKRHQKKYKDKFKNYLSQVKLLSGHTNL